MNGLDKFYESEGKPSSDSIKLFSETFLKYGSDKSGYHTYEMIYSNLFDNTELIQDVLEMGIHLGGSLRAWKDLFPNAKVVGLENNPERFFTEDRITSFYVDQSIEETFNNFINFIDGRMFDFIIDDGSHYLKETKTTFKKLLPILEVGGWFVVEDIKSEFEEEWKSISENLSENYTSYLINMNDLNETRSNDNIVLVVRRNW